MSSWRFICLLLTSIAEDIIHPIRVLLNFRHRISHRVHIRKVALDEWDGFLDIVLALDNAQMWKTSPFL